MQKGYAEMISWNIQFFGGRGAGFGGRGATNSDYGKELNKLGINTDFSAINNNLSDNMKSAMKELAKLMREYDSTLVGVSIYKDNRGFSSEDGKALMLNNQTGIALSTRAFVGAKNTDGYLGEKEYLRTTYHEFAHTLAQSRQMLDKDKKFWREIGAIRKEYMEEVRTGATRISSYATKDRDEFLAEAFANAKLSKNPSPYAIRVLQVVDKYFKKKNSI